VSGNEKLLKKVAEERAKGQHDRALTRLKEGIAESPRDFEIVREAAALCFELGRTLDGAGLLRAAMRRLPASRPVAIEMLEVEFNPARPLELGEILYEAHLMAPDYDHAREIANALAETDRVKLLSKLRTKLASVREEAPNDALRLVALMLAEALVLSSLARSVEVAVMLECVLDLEPAQVTVVGRLAKYESKQNPLCPEVQLLLARSYLAVDKPELAVDMALAAAKRPEARPAALQLLEKAPDVPFVQRARAEILLRDSDVRGAMPLLERLAQGEDTIQMVRQTLDGLQDAMDAAPELRLLHARALARTGAGRQAIKELEAVAESGFDTSGALEVVEELSVSETHSADLSQLRARLAVGAHAHESASAAIKQLLETDPARAEKLCVELEAAAQEAGNAHVDRLLTELYLKLEKPQEAAESLRRLRQTKGAPPEALHQLASDIAGEFGLSANLLVVFVEAALDIDRDDEARAAVAHYLSSPGARTAEFTALLGELVRERGALAPRIVRALEGLALPADVRLGLAIAALQGEDTSSALLSLERLVLERPELLDTARTALEQHLKTNDKDPGALVLSAEWLDAVGRPVEAVQRLAAALRGAPSETDRVCKAAEKVLRRSPGQDELWREIVLALLDAQRHRHARELCYLASQVLPPEKQGFVHLALGEIMLTGGQLQNAVNECESALGCEDTPFDRLVQVLEKAVEADTRSGYARYVLAAALLREGHGLDGAVLHLSAAVQQDDLLVDLAFELLTEYAPVLEAHAPARVLEGLLFLRRGDRMQGVALLARALQLQPELAAQVVGPLEAEWDRDSQNPAVGLAFVRALRGAGQARRACRLATDLSARFSDLQDPLIDELEALVAAEALPEAHRTLWELLLDCGQEARAIGHLEAALEIVAPDATASRELLEAGLRRQPEVAWIACRLAESEARGGNLSRAEELLRRVADAHSGEGEIVLRALRSDAFTTRTTGLQILEVDCLLAVRRDTEAFEVLRRLRGQEDVDRGALIERYRSLVARATVSVVAELELGALFKAAGRVEDTVAVLEGGLTRSESPTVEMQDPGAVRELRLTLAQYYVELGREQEGRDLLSTVLDRPGDHQETYGVLERLARQGLLSKLKSLRTTIATYPGNLRARLELARLSIVSMDYEGAREALAFTGDSPALEAGRRYLLARSHADEDHPDLALAVLRSIALPDVTDDELRRNVAYLKGVCCELLGQYGEAHTLFLHILSEFPYFKDTRDRVRRTYQRHLESSVEPRAEVLEKRTQMEVAESAIERTPKV